MRLSACMCTSNPPFNFYLRYLVVVVFSKNGVHLLACKFVLQKNSFLLAYLQMKIFLWISWRRRVTEAVVGGVVGLGERRKSAVCCWLFFHKRFLGMVKRRPKQRRLMKQRDLWSGKDIKGKRLKIALLFFQLFLSLIRSLAATRPGRVGTVRQDCVTRCIEDAVDEQMGSR